MTDLSIRVGDLNFTARWEPDAPLTRDALRALLPLRSKLIHCRWSGEGCWIPFGEVRLPVGYENHTSHPAPGEIIVYTGDLSEGEILIAYGAVDFSSMLGQLAGNHFATIVSADAAECASNCARWAAASSGTGPRTSSSRSGRS